ncbi:hypothetical protein [Thermopetrobacter sp. TC1]|uniref:hypothetical protein n=1 Tax=Thermopetrobacter sp. TC1 TaxID=1495045 RepID=UPI00056E5939|nr:hypothetical protein [Thermopetrobacter sp. TC1]
MKLRDFAFWTLVVLLGALAVHAGLAVWLPRRIMAGLFEQAAALGAENTFVLLPSGKEPEFLRPLPQGTRAGLCLIRPGDQAVEIRAPLDGGYWSIAAYGPDGSVVFALDDRHALGREMRMIFAHAAAGSDMTNTGLRTATIRGDSLFIPMATQTVLAVVKVHAPYPGMEPRLLNTLRQTQCRRIPLPAFLQGTGKQKLSSSEERMKRTFAVPLPRERPGQ